MGLPGLLGAWFPGLARLLGLLGLHHLAECLD
jgi:hypothetical protein